MMSTHKRHGDTRGVMQHDVENLSISIEKEIAYESWSCCSYAGQPVLLLH